MKTIHIFGSFHNPHGGSEAEALRLYELLRGRRDVRLWAISSRASPALLDRFPIGRASSMRLALLDGGTYVFVGQHWRKGIWRFLARRPERLIYVYNTFHPKISAITSAPPRGWPPTEYVFISEFQQRLLELDGVVHPSPIDIEQFTPAQRAPGDRLVIGRMSRDSPDKFSADDVPIYAALIREGHAVRLQGATCQKERLAGTGVELLPTGQDAPANFLRGLDVFYYRTGEHVETFGRVVFEAMACGLPIVCHSHGGYADWIRSGENGFLFDTSEQARDILARLLADAGLRRRIGANARRTVEGMYSREAQEKRLAFYLR